MSAQALTLESLLRPFGFDPKARIKLVRHRDSKYDIDLLCRAGHLEFYQSIQASPVFQDCERLVSFRGLPGTHALFVGVYDVLGVAGPHGISKPEGFPYAEMDTSRHYRYELSLDERFEALRDRLVIDWGSGTRSWVQHYRPDKQVVEVRPAGYVKEFPGFMDVVLRHDELVRIIKHPSPHRDWHRMLGSVSAVYLILDIKTGNQYVGSAYGDAGLLGRWRTYAETIHGGNAQLRALVASRPDAAQDLQFAVLQTLPLTLTAKEVVDGEMRHKRKLGTRAHGLNSN